MFAHLLHLDFFQMSCQQTMNDQTIAEWGFVCVSHSEAGFHNCVALWLSWCPLFTKIASIPLHQNSIHEAGTTAFSNV